MGLGEEIDQSLGDGSGRCRRLHRSPPGLGIYRRRAQRGEIAEMAREAPRIGFPDMADAERVEEAVNGDFAPRLDRSEQIAGRDLAKALAFAEARTV